MTNKSQHPYKRKNHGTPKVPHHKCNWPGCEKNTKQWGCHTHFLMLPPDLQAKVQATYRPGQEQDGQPSTQYLMVQLEINELAKSMEEKKDAA